jgi:hypothetical protein
VAAIHLEGLPVCGHESEIVADLARAGSRNHRLLLRLREFGAIIMGTESAELLVEEYQLSSKPSRSNRRRLLRQGPEARLRISVVIC